MIMQLLFPAATKRQTHILFFLTPRRMQSIFIPNILLLLLLFSFLLHIPVHTMYLQQRYSQIHSGVSKNNTQHNSKRTHAVPPFLFARELPSIVENIRTERKSLHNPFNISHHPLQSRPCIVLRAANGHPFQAYNHSEWRR